MPAYPTTTHSTSTKKTDSRRKPTPFRPVIPTLSPPGMVQRATANPKTARPAEILALQRTCGNQAVQRLSGRHTVQAKLTVGPVGDGYEQEADRVADQVTAGVQPARAGQRALQRTEAVDPIQEKPLVNAITPLPAVQGKAAGDLVATPGLESRLASAQGGGTPLPDSVRATMEPRFGADFSGVRLHTDGEAAQLNQGLGAKAFTHGADIYLGAGAEKPGTPAGNHLLAHELTHTLQQSGGPRLQGWWPKGHRLITSLAVKKGGFTKFFGEAALNFLVDRSPDIDFIQDETTTMEEGIQASKPRLDMYENLIKQGQDPAARGLWERNELHMRRPEYMLSHGEGGRYKEADGSGKNEAMTSRLVDKAESQWKWNDQATWGRSLEILSDALHQAEDRGSHGEGNQFSGHDIRLNLKKWLKKQKRQAKAWEVFPEGAPGDGWEPDNFDINQKGGVVGVGFAQGVLGKFASDLAVREARPIDLPSGDTKKTTQPKKRTASFKGLPSVASTNVLGKTQGSTGGGAKKLEQVFDETMKQAGVEGAYNQSKEHPVETHAPESFRAKGGDLDKGVGFYAEGRPSLEKQAETMTDIMTRAYVQFKEWGKLGSKFGRGLSREYREKRVKAYLQKEKDKYAKDPEKQQEVVEAIQAAHIAVFGYPIPKDI